MHKVRSPLPVSAGGVGRARPDAQVPRQQALPRSMSAVREQLPASPSSSQAPRKSAVHTGTNLAHGPSAGREPHFWNLTLGRHRPGLASEPLTAFLSLPRLCPVQAAASGLRLPQAVQVASGGPGLHLGTSAGGCRTTCDS